MRLLVLLAALAALPLLARAEAEIDGFPAIGSGRAVTVSGRVLRQRSSKDGSALAKNLERLTSGRLEGVEVELAFEGQTARSVTGDDGFFEVTFTAPRTQPFTPGAKVAQLSAGGAHGVLPVQVIADDAPFLVVSDFDDTLAVTQVVHPRKMLRAALLQDGETQPAVPGMAALFRCLSQAKVAPAFALVSGSPQQFVPRTMTFLRANDFPFLGLYLRDLGPGTLKGYKEPVIRALLTRFPSLPVLAFGDSGEHDPEVYARIRREFPGRLARVYIRDAGHAEDPARFPEMLLFHDAAEAARDAAQRGFAPGACVEAAFPSK